MDALAATCAEVARRRSRNAKLATVASYLRGLPDEDLVRAARFLAGGPFARADPRSAKVGWATLRDATAAATGYEPDLVALCAHEAGDAAEAAALLATGRSEGRPLSLAAAEGLYEALAAARKPAEKRRLLEEVIRTRRPPAIGVFLEVLGGELRIGLQARLIEDAIAEATGAPREDVREAARRTGDLGRVALAARRGALAAIEAPLFQPVEFMLAKPLERAGELDEPAAYAIEEKLDGIRAQAHLAPGRVALYSRNLAEITAAFPELAAALAELPGTAVLDGEILGWRDGRALSFTLFQQRLARKEPTPALCAEVPVAFVAYDLLQRDGRLYLHEPLEARRATLEALLAGASPPVLLSPVLAAAEHVGVSRLFEEALAHGNEGLVLKRRGSRYEPGRRGGAWRKLKAPLATLDVVVTAAQRGHGRRASVLSDVTFAVRDGDRLVNVGKAYSGLTDEELRALTARFQELAISRHGPVVVVRPEVVLEVAFDGVQRSARHRSGYALRFPRIVRWRRDKRPDQIDELPRLAALFAASRTGGAGGVPP